MNDCPNFFEKIWYLIYSNWTQIVTCVWFASIGWCPVPAKPNVLHTISCCDWVVTASDDCVARDLISTSVTCVDMSFTWFVYCSGWTSRKIDMNCSYRMASCQSDCDLSHFIICWPCDIRRALTECWVDAIICSSQLRFSRDWRPVYNWALFASYQSLEKTNQYKKYRCH